MNQSPSPSFQERKGDARIYIISIFFLSCIIAGGVFLGLYIFFPTDRTQPWYSVAGMVLVGIPWIFWFFTYLYRCFSPKSLPSQSSKSVTKSSSSSMNSAALPSQNNVPCDDSHLNSQSSNGTGGARHVHFGGIVVISEHEHESENGRSDQDGHEGGERRSGGSSSTLHEENNRESESPFDFL